MHRLTRCFFGSLAGGAGQLPGVSLLGAAPEPAHGGHAPGNQAGTARFGGQGQDAGGRNCRATRRRGSRRAHHDAPREVGRHMFRVRTLSPR